MRLLKERVMLIFRIKDKVYSGDSALAIVSELERDTRDYPRRGRAIRHFLLWSLERLRDHIPPREMDLSDRMDEEALALNYLCVRDEYGAGELIVRRGNAAGEKGMSAADR